ncbi:TPA: DUF3696 domain-containing protein [Stenotrophomonas maltophilia]|nr:DUF3696 domain-containing protein [Stenotrophomonas maltophilia]
MGISPAWGRLVMIKSIKLRNFKSIKETQKISFAPLSLVCGANSSGKSSLIQSILMVSQTFSSRHFRSSVSLNGKMVRLGSFADIKNHSSGKQPIDVSLELSFPELRKNPSDTTEVEIDLHFSGGAGEKSVDADFHPEIVRARIAHSNRSGDSGYLEFRVPKEKARRDIFEVVRISSEQLSILNKIYPDYRVEGVSKDELVPSTLYIDYDHTRRLSLCVVGVLIGEKALLKDAAARDVEDLENARIPGEVVGRIATLVGRDFTDRVESFVIPDEVIRLVNKAAPHGKSSSITKRVKELLIRQAAPLTPDSVSFLTSMAKEGVGYPEWREEVSKMDERVRKAFFEFLLRHRDEIQSVWYGSNKKARRSARLSLSSFKQLDSHLAFVFDRGVKYLGPLRNEPQAMYQAFSLSDPTMVGLKGEFTAAVLHINKSVKIDYLSPLIGDDGRLSFEKKRETLAVASTDWLRYLGVVSEVQTFDRGRLGYELQVKVNPGDSWQDLTHVGVGVSQVLPIVVMSLLSSPDDVLIFEQPELHLHPKVQSRLFDFFLSITESDRQCVIETHSEYMVNRLRLRTVESRSSDFSKKCSVLFVDKFEGATKFRSVDITRFGSILSWPKDFFDQTDMEVERILMEASAKKREEGRSSMIASEGKLGG